MTEKQLQQIIRQIKRKTAMITILGDIQETFAMEIIEDLKNIGSYTQYSKKTINAVKKNTELFKTEINKRYKDNDDMKLAFGDISDIVKEFIESLVNYNKEPDEAN